MKRTIKLMAMLLCVAAILPLWSCSRDEDDNDYTENNEFGNYTLGKYHPVKKIKTMNITAPNIWGSVLPGFSLYNYYEFTWNGDKIESIKYTDNNDNEETYNYSYLDNGYIGSITAIDKNGNSSVQNIKYSKNRVLCLPDDGRWGFYVEDFEFDDNGIVTRINGKDISDVQNGNPMGIISANGTILEYDNHPNPFKNIILPKYLYDLFMELQLDASLVSSNNPKYHGIDYEDYENANAYPTSFSGANSTSLDIEYMN